MNTDPSQLKNSGDPDATNDSRGVTLFLCGDVMTGRGIDQAMSQSVSSVIYESYVKDARDYVRLAERKNGPIRQPISYAYSWGDALAVWRAFSPDLKIINLETSITTHPEPWLDKPVQYRMHPANVAVLRAAGINLVSLANNHTLDWQREGLLETLRTLQKAGIHYVGAGRDLQEAAKPAVLKVRQGRVIVLAYGSETGGVPHDWAATARQSGVNLLPDLSMSTVRNISKQVKALKQPGDIVVFSVHWGSNWGHAIPDTQRSFAHWLIDSSGVDLIHGHSSHHPRAIEVYKGKLILYGAGDFINDYEGISGHEAYRGDLTLLYFPVIDAATGKLLSAKLVPMQIRNFRLNYASAADSRWLTNKLDEESRQYGTMLQLDDKGIIRLQWR
ncbi:CapA family protein [uncultured Pontibacter sp.]|uniref:CapA family protein n=1 Tax=uncultured Pontibacter sp. TaxID=453356 RepID=UPI002630256E|nr:CapA family protein [uncultured Pontibacter sp.]